MNFHGTESRGSLSVTSQQLNKFTTYSSIYSTISYIYVYIYITCIIIYTLFTNLRSKVLLLLCISNTLIEYLQKKIQKQQY